MQYGRIKCFSLTALPAAYLPTSSQHKEGPFFYLWLIICSIKWIWVLGNLEEICKTLACSCIFQKYMLSASRFSESVGMPPEWWMG
jgi:hypothetical protein